MRSHPQLGVAEDMLNAGKWDESDRDHVRFDLHRLNGASSAFMTEAEFQAVMARALKRRPTFRPEPTVRFFYQF